MKKIRCLVGVIVFSIAATNVQAGSHGGHHGHWGGGGIGFSMGYRGFYSPGFGFYPGYGYGYGFGAPYYPYYANPPVVRVVPEIPPVYVQRGEVQPNVPLSANFWYYCRSPSGYYPYVKTCPGGWQQVAPVPADQ